MIEWVRVMILYLISIHQHYSDSFSDQYMWEIFGSKNFEATHRSQDGSQPFSCMRMLVRLLCCKSQKVIKVELAFRE